MKTMHTKICSNCKAENAVARKVCLCGFVFKKKISLGFHETPVILTPERLRTAGRPVRIKPKLQQHDFVYESAARAKIKAWTKTATEFTETMKSNEKKKKEDQLSMLGNTKEVETANTKHENVEGSETTKPILEIQVFELSNKRCAYNANCSVEDIQTKTNVNTLSKPKPEKLYPKRQRSCTSKFEPLNVGCKRKKEDSIDHVKVEKLAVHDMSDIMKNNEISVEKNDSGAIDKNKSTINNLKTNNLIGNPVVEDKMIVDASSHIVVKQNTPQNTIDTNLCAKEVKTNTVSNASSFMSEVAPSIVNMEMASEINQVSFIAVKKEAVSYSNENTPITPISDMNNIELTTNFDNKKSVATASINKIGEIAHSENHKNTIKTTIVTDSDYKKQTTTIDTIGEITPSDNNINTSITTINKKIAVSANTNYLVSTSNNNPKAGLPPANSTSTTGLPPANSTSTGSLQPTNSTSTGAINIVEAPTKNNTEVTDNIEVLSLSNNTTNVFLNSTEIQTASTEVTKPLVNIKSKGVVTLTTKDDKGKVTLTTKDNKGVVTLTMKDNKVISNFEKKMKMTTNSVKSLSSSNSVTVKELITKTNDGIDIDKTKSIDPFVDVVPNNKSDVNLEQLLFSTNMDQQIDIINIKGDKVSDWRNMMLGEVKQRSQGITYPLSKDGFLRVKIPDEIKSYIKQKRARRNSYLKSTTKSPKSKRKYKHKDTALSPTEHIKRPVGRPRIHFSPKLPKKPVGRPRKTPLTLEVNPVHKLLKSPKSPKPTKVPKSPVLMSPRSKEKVERFSKIAAVQSVAEYAEEDITSVTDTTDSESDTTAIKFVRKKGRPRKDEKFHHMDPHFHHRTPGKLLEQRSGRCFLSPPSLIASAKKERIRNEILETVEHDRLTKKLRKMKPSVIPPEKQELFTMILDDINRRILSQSFIFQSHSMNE